LSGTKVDDIVEWSKPWLITQLSGLNRGRWLDRSVVLQLCILGLTCYFIYQQNSSLGGDTLFHSSHTDGFCANKQSNLH